jgi:hypothetical protein
MQSFVGPDGSRPGGSVGRHATDEASLSAGQLERTVDRARLSSPAYRPRIARDARLPPAVRPRDLERAAYIGAEDALCAPDASGIDAVTASDFGDASALAPLLGSPRYSAPDRTDCRIREPPSLRMSRSQSVVRDKESRAGSTWMPVHGVTPLLACACSHSSEFDRHRRVCPRPSCADRKVAARGRSLDACLGALTGAHGAPKLS